MAEPWLPTADWRPGSRNMLLHAAVPASPPASGPVRVNVSLDKALPACIDGEAGRRGVTRPGFLAGRRKPCCGADGGCGPGTRYGGSSASTRASISAATPYAARAARMARRLAVKCPASSGTAAVTASTRDAAAAPPARPQAALRPARPEQHAHVLLRRQRPARPQPVGAQSVPQPVLHAGAEVAINDPGRVADQDVRPLLRPRQPRRPRQVAEHGDPDAVPPGAIQRGASRRIAA